VKRRFAGLPLLAVFVALLVATAAAAATMYVNPRVWYAGQGASSSYSPYWAQNNFSKSGSGFDTTVTFIDNVTYGWHATVRNTATTTHTFWSLGGTKKGYCLAHTSYFWGSCWVD